MKHPLLRHLRKLKRKKKPNTEPCGIPAKTGALDEH